MRFPFHGDVARPKWAVEALGKTAVLWLCALLMLAACDRAPDAPRTSVTPPPREISSTTKPSSPWFQEIGTQAGLTFRHSTGHRERFYMPEVVTGGVGLLDFNGDGLLDVFCVNGGSLDPSATNRPGHQLFLNLGGFRFEDVTARAGVGGHGEYGMGCACADYDGDGHVDIYVSHLNGGLLYHNNGDGTFTDGTRAAGLDGTGWGTSCAFLDYDNDGRLDLVVANYLRWSRETELTCYSRGGLPDYCSPLNYKAPALDTLYRNKGNGTFEDVTVAAGLDKAYGNGLGVACADFDHDGRIDIYIANDATPNQLWMNKGNGTFVDEALIRGCAVSSVGMPRAGMGVALADTHERGWLDLFVTHLVGEGNGWFVHSTNGYFSDFISPRGPNARSSPLTGFGVGFHDFDNDGNLDLYVANGRVKYGVRDVDPNDPYAEPNTLLRGLGSGEFQEVNPPGGTTPVLLAASRGAAFGDLDNDGGVDIVVVNKDRPAHLLRNTVESRGHWITFHVVTSRGTEALNARVRIEADGRMYFRDVLPHQSYCSSNDPRVHFGLGKGREVARVVVRWPRGGEEMFGPFAADQIHALRQGAGRPSNGVFGY